VLCLSDTGVDPLLWSHYSDGHKGFCIGFHRYKLIKHLKSKTVKGDNLTYSDIPFLKQVFLDKAKTLNALIEKKEAEQEKIDRWASIDLFPDLNHISLRLKHDAWKYEKERRFIYNGKPKAIPFPSTAISQIIFGMKMDNYSKEVIRRVLSAEQWKHIDYKTVSPKTDSLAFDIVPEKEVTEDSMGDDID